MPSSIMGIVWSVHIENSFPLAWLEIIQYNRYQKLLRSYDLEEIKNEQVPSLLI